MTTPSPLCEYYETETAAGFIPYGELARIVGQFEAMETEYAAIRKGAALLDCPHHGLLKITGADRLEFLNRLLTNACADLQAGAVQRNFMLNAKGRILADLLLIERGDCTLVDLDLHNTQQLADELDALLFGEDVQIASLSESYHKVSIFGPKAEDVLEWFTTTTDTPEDQPIYHYAYDLTASDSSHLWAPSEVFARFVEKAEDLKETFDLKHIGWLAFNIARVEAGRPLFNVDFGPNNLPHETGVLGEAVSFTKGCYRGQEVVARMESQGHPAKLLVGFRGKTEALPIAATAVYDSSDSEANAVGAVTSSTHSPMRSARPVGFAMVKWGYHEVGTSLYTPADGVTVEVEVTGLAHHTA
ncbi:MAG: CAF17-like 4Fe-4S cluster assembly/insertion protein YgfZ [Planctomycetota bacterium]|jgi:folate-binding protein YgfZ